MLRRRLILGVLVTAPRDWKRLRAKIEETAAALGMIVDVDRGTGDNRQRLDGRSHVTVIGAPLKARRSPPSPAGSPTPAPTSTASSGWRATP